MCISSLTMYEDTWSTRSSILRAEVRAIVLHQTTNDIGRDTRIESVVRATEDVEGIRHIRYFLVYE